MYHCLRDCLTSKRLGLGFYCVEFVSLPGLLYKQLQDETESHDYATKTVFTTCKSLKKARAPKLKVMLI